MPDCRNVVRVGRIRETDAGGPLILVIAEPRAVRTSDVISVVYAVDISTGVNEARIALDFSARDAAQRAAADVQGWLYSGGRLRLSIRRERHFRLKSTSILRSVRRHKSGAVIWLSAAMLPEENHGRIVLISDGTETVGQLRDVVDDLQARGIQVNVVPSTMTIRMKSCWNDWIFHDLFVRGAMRHRSSCRRSRLVGEHWPDGGREDDCP